MAVNRAATLTSKCLDREWGGQFPVIDPVIDQIAQNWQMLLKEINHRSGLRFFIMLLRIAAYNRFHPAKFQTFSPASPEFARHPYVTSQADQSRIAFIGRKIRGL